MDPDFLIDILKMNSLGVTSPRIILLEFLFEKNEPFVELSHILKMSSRRISRTTLYRTLISFCLADLLYKITDHKNKVFYGIGFKLRQHIKLTELTNKDNYHFQCKSCGKIFCLPVKMHTIELPEGFTKTDSNLLLSGDCNLCIPKDAKKGIKFY